MLEVITLGLLIGAAIILAGERIVWTLNHHEGVVIRNCSFTGVKVTARPVEIEDDLVSLGRAERVIS